MVNLIKPEYKASARALTAETKAVSKLLSAEINHPASKGRKSEFKTQAKAHLG
jgi:hypothetical protein